jgi:hypothetical protein
LPCNRNNTVHFIAVVADVAVNNKTVAVLPKKHLLSCNKTFRASVNRSESCEGASQMAASIHLQQFYYRWAEY